MLSRSEFFANGDAKGLANIRTANGENVLIATENQDSVKTFISGRNGSSHWIQVKKDDDFADIQYNDNKKRRIEFYYGSAFLSQSSRGFEVGMMQ